MNDLLKEMRELIQRLNEASKAYYQDAREIMSNYEYDALYDRLLTLEKETGTVLADSPSIHVGYEVLSELQRRITILQCFRWIRRKMRERSVHGLGTMKGCSHGSWMV